MNTMYRARVGDVMNEYVLRSVLKKYGCCRRDVYDEVESLSKSNRHLFRKQSISVHRTQMKLDDQIASVSRDIEKLDACLGNLESLLFDLSRRLRYKLEQSRESYATAAAAQDDDGEWLVCD